MENLKILVPLDFSDLSTKALQAAQGMAKIFEGSVTPFHAYIPVTEMDGPYTLGIGPNTGEDYEDVEDALQQRLDQTAADYVEPNLLNKGRIAVGNPAHCIIDSSFDYGMIVMSTHGRTGFSRMLLGSVAEKVLRLSHCPVIVVEKESHFDPIDRILVTTDFSDNSYTAFPYAYQIAKATGAELDLMHILSYDQFEDQSTAQTFVSLREQRLHVLAKEYFHDIGSKVNPEVIVSSDTPHETILNLDTERDYNLIVMATVGRTGIDYLMMGSTTANVVRHVETAVLSINPKRPDDRKQLEDETEEE